MDRMSDLTHEVEAMLRFLSGKAGKRIYGERKDITEEQRMYTFSLPEEGDFHQWLVCDLGQVSQVF